jgi:hypothetical protein
MVTAAVEDYIAANAARQALFGFANAALGIQGHLHRGPVFPESAILLCGGDAVHVVVVGACCRCLCPDVFSLMESSQNAKILGAVKAPVRFADLCTCPLLGTVIAVCSSSCRRDNDSSC